MEARFGIESMPCMRDGTERRFGSGWRDWKTLLTKNLLYCLSPVWLQPWETNPLWLIFGLPQAPPPPPAREARRGGERVACVASVSARVRREKLGRTRLETLATQAREREKWGTTKPKLLTLYVALTMHNSLPAASHLLTWGDFHARSTVPEGKWGLLVV